MTSPLGRLPTIIMCVAQVYNYHRLLSWDEERGLHMDIYKVLFLIIVIIILDIYMLRGGPREAL